MGKNVDKLIYSKEPGIVIGFHGTDKTVVEKVIKGEDSLLKSDKDYDWLGHGIYFWENNYSRAIEFAEDYKKEKSIKNPAVIGAVIDLGNCLNLIESKALSILKETYDLWEKTFIGLGKSLPVNELSGNRKKFSFKRYLDCFIIEQTHTVKDNESKDGPFYYDSVRGVFWEGEELYPGAGFMSKNHIQICVRNPNCIIGYFNPRELDNKYSLP